MKTTIMVLVLAVELGLPASAQTAKLNVLHSFGASDDGTEPNGPLVLDSSGNLYGVTFGGPGEYGNGLVFELTPQNDGTWQETILHSFSAGDDGGFPWGALLLSSSGDLYGTMEGDLSYAVGGVFELSPGLSGWSNTVIYANSAGPGLLTSTPGTLYGKIGPGDYFGLGAIGELSPGSGGWTYTQLYSFTCQPTCADGYGPPAPPIWDSQGDMWGTMFNGGIGEPACANDPGGCGVIYVMTPNGDGTWSYHVAHRFASSPLGGEGPDAGLTSDAAGNFYGDTEGGGTHGYGIIFRFSVTDGKLKGSAIYNFSGCSTGCYPEGTLAIDKAGNLYGMAQGGSNSCGGFSCGVVYRLAPQKNGTWKYSVLVDLDEYTGGVLPFYGLILDDKGDLFGVTSSGGQYGFGTAFEISP